MSKPDFSDRLIQISPVAIGLPSRRLSTVAFFLACQMAFAADLRSGQDNTTRAEESVSVLLADTPYINSLLIDREFPVLGGRWGWEMFVDAPLNGEPNGADLTLRRDDSAA